MRYGFRKLSFVVMPVWRIKHLSLKVFWPYATEYCTAEPRWMTYLAISFIIYPPLRIMLSFILSLTLSCMHLTFFNWVTALSLINMLLKSPFKSSSNWKFGNSPVLKCQTNICESTSRTHCKTPNIGLDLFKFWIFQILVGSKCRPDPSDFLKKSGPPIPRSLGKVATQYICSKLQVGIKMRFV